MNKDEGKERGARPQLPGLNELTLTEKAAEELRQRLDKPSARPARPPRDLPQGDPSLLYHKAREG
jgi:hypothetical protein